MAVQVPATAVAGDDIWVPTETLLCRLNLLPPPPEMKEAGGVKAAFTGPPESVALIEAGATAAAKWWAAGLGGAVVTAWTAVIGWWDVAGEANQRVVLWAVGIVTSAAVLGIAYLLGSDVRGRAAVAAQTIRARADVAGAFVRMAELAYARNTPRDARLAIAAPPVDLHDRMVGVPPMAVVRAATGEAGWLLVALLSNGSDRTRYLVVKGTAHEWVDADAVRIP